MTDPLELYITILLGAAVCGLILAAFVYAVAGIFVLFALIGIFTWIAIETVVKELLPKLPWLIFILLKKTVAALLAALKRRRQRRARGVAPHTAEPEWQSRAREKAQREAREDAVLRRIDGWEPACKILGLPPEGFSKQQLSRAYRHAMRTAHPDLGGSQAKAKALNIARDIIRSQQGWA